jgi:hypothetical protein
MEKIVIIGSTGAGKTTLTRKLEKKVRFRHSKNQKVELIVIELRATTKGNPDLLLLATEPVELRVRRPKRALENAPQTRTELDTEFRYKRDFLHKVYEDSYRQAHRSFNVALAALVTGILLIIVGSILAYTMNLPIGILTSVSSTITEIVSVLAFKLSADSNKRLESYSKELSAVELANWSIQYIEQMENNQERDRAIADLVRDLRAKSH